MLQLFPNENNRFGSGRRGNEECPNRLTERHFPTSLPVEEKSKKVQVRRCVVCSKHGKRIESQYMCKELNLVALKASACCSTVSLTIFQKHSEMAMLSSNVICNGCSTISPGRKVKKGVVRMADQPLLETAYDDDNEDGTTYLKILDFLKNCSS
ncbi:hypothetical protein J437_LFUL012451 [Ladona fulva]|uniref:Uncharacterized protein n=1 Tax=Ladona fulva TaxID=123851 RepID=A0A8K0KDI1_LADFU|nr:hypothetical protein J437_LFUL012451 [Ladona fulva]